MNDTTKNQTPYRVLSLDGGGAKGFYTLGVLREVEAMLGRPLYQDFDLIFGASTGAIIAALLAIGKTVEEIHTLYKEFVPKVMGERTAAGRSAALETLGNQIFDKATFSDVKTGVGIVATKWVIERPMIFKGSIAQAHGRKATFAPGFGVSISDAVQASCSAYPFFERKMVTTSAGDKVELIDGGYCANNPSLYAVADALMALTINREDLRVLSVGVGTYPPPKPRSWAMRLARFIPTAQLLQKTLEINTQSMDQLYRILFKDVKTVRVNSAFSEPAMATDLMEHDLEKLNILRQRGVESFAAVEAGIADLLSQH